MLSGAFGMAVELNVLAAVGKCFFFTPRSHSLLLVFVLLSGKKNKDPVSPVLFRPSSSPSYQSSACHRPTRAGLRTLASNLGAMDPVTSYRWRRAAAPTWQGCRPGTRSWKLKVTTCQLWVPKPSSPSPRPRRTFLPASEWCPAYSRSSSFSVRCMW